MERLLKDAQAITGVKYDVDNLADVYTAIGVIQEKLGIAGTTAKEAATTISGSATMVKASWQNVLVAVSGGGDLDVAIKNLVYSVEKYFDNIVPVVERSLSGIGDLIAGIAPKLVETVGRALIRSIPTLVIAVYEMMLGLAKGVIDGIKALFSGTAKKAIEPQIKAIDKAADSQNSLTEAVEETAKAQKKSLAGFDTLQTIASNSADAASEEPIAMPQVTSGGAGGILGEYDNSLADNITKDLATIMAVVGPSMIAIGLIVLFTGSIAWGVGLIIAGALTIGVTVASVKDTDMAADVIGVLTTIMGVVSGALVAIGIILITLGSTAIGVSLIVAGAMTLIGSVATLVGFKVATIKNILNLIMGIAGGAMLAIGIMLCIFAGPSPVSIGLIIAGAISLVSAIALNSNAVVEAIRGPLGLIMGIVGSALLVIGIILCCTGVALPLGISLIALGAASLGTTIALNWNTIVDKVKSIGKAISNVFVKIWDGIKKGFKAMVNGIISYANLWIDGLNLLLLPVRGLIVGIAQAFGQKLTMKDIKIPHIPKLAQGAVIPPNREFLAILGDQKSGTNIEAPLSTIVDAFKAVQGNQKVEINFTGSLAQLARILSPEISTENNRASVFAKG